MVTVARAWDGRCQSPPIPEVDLGESCVLERNVTCEAVEFSDRHCGRDGECQEQVATGESCDTPTACKSVDDYCRGLRLDGPTAGICTPRVGAGGACDPEEVGPCSVHDGLYYCSGEGTCARQWPAVCSLFTRAPGEYEPRSWIPLH